MIAPTVLTPMGTHRRSGGKTTTTASTTTHPARRSPGFQSRSSRHASSLVKTKAVDASSLSDVLTLDSAAKAGLIVFGARVAALGAGKAKQGSDLDKALRDCADRGIDVSDLYYAEDQGEQQWYLVGNWAVPKKGDPKYGDGRMSQEVRSRVRLHDCKALADARGVEYGDIEEHKALYPTTPKKAIELRRRLTNAGVEVESW
jgi:hypothetical protein